VRLKAPGKLCFDPGCSSGHDAPMTATGIRPPHSSSGSSAARPCGGAPALLGRALLGSSPSLLTSLPLDRVLIPVLTGLRLPAPVLTRTLRFVLARSGTAFPVKFSEG